VRVLALLLLACVAAPAPEAARSTLVWWAWEQPEDLRGLPAPEEVAALLRTLRDEGGALQVIPRRQPLRIDPGTPLTAVVRLELDGQPLIEEVVAALLPAVSRPEVVRLQLDFDARASQRAWYRALLEALRPRLSVPLSITALASWCTGDPWLEGAPIDEQVPMLFDLGADAPVLQARLARGGDVLPDCQSAWGLSSAGELFPPPSPRRIYLFHPGPGSAEARAGLRQRLARTAG
jgi:hypothetical protein